MKLSVLDVKNVAPAAKVAMNVNLRADVKTVEFVMKKLSSVSVRLDGSAMFVRIDVNREVSV